MINLTPVAVAPVITLYILLVYVMCITLPLAFLLLISYILLKIQESKKHTKDENKSED